MSVAPRAEPSSVVFPAATRVTLGILFAGVLLGALDIAIVGPALPAIREAFGVDSRALSWVFNVYILVALVAAPFVAKVSDSRGRRTVYVGCVLVFGAGSALVAFAPSFGWLLAGRAVQACGAGGLLPVASAVVADTVPAERRGRALGLIGAVFGVAFVVGPLLGGLLLPWGWQWLFLVNLPLVLAIAVASARTLPEASPGTRAPFDWRGAGLLTAVLVTAAWALGEGSSAGPSGRGIALLGAAFGAAAFIRWERRAVDPILPPQLLASRELRIVAAIAAATGLVEAGMVFLPSLAVASFGVEPSRASYMMLPLVATLIVGAPSAGRALDRYGARPVIQAGLGLTVLGLLLFALAPSSLVSFYAAGACTGLGLSGLLGAPLRFIVLREAGDARRGAGQGLLTLCLSSGRIAGAALIGGIAAASPVAGHRRALLYLALACLAALVLSLALRRPGRAPA